MHKRRLFLILFIITILAASLWGWLHSPSRTPQLPSLISRNTLDSLSKKDGSSIDIRHLADGIAPPTNKWYSGLALQAEPKTVFPTPLSFSARENGFSYSLPTAASSSDTVMAAVSASIEVSIRQATTYQVTRYDELSVDLTYAAGTTPLGTVTLVAGSPYIQFTASQPVTLDIRSSQGAITVSDDQLSFETNTGHYLASAFFEGKIAPTADGAATAKLPTDGLLTFMAAPADRPVDTLLEYAGNRIVSTHVSYSQRGDDYQTTLAVNTRDGRPTVYSYLPHQKTAATEVFSYSTIYGKQTVITGNNFSFTTPAITVSASLKLDDISTEQRDLLTTTLRREVNATRYTATDTYFGGKELYRSAQLLQLARQLDEPQVADIIQSKLRSELEIWLSSGENNGAKYFYYNPRIHSVIGETVAFGSQDNNDHHFHYGYFIYAASILATYDLDFLNQYANSVNLLVADIANYEDGEQLPLRRAFDPYFGHSWASGNAPFNDGNNQESSSEALNAWIATSLWAERTGNKALADQSAWMLSNESSATQAYWLAIEPSQAPFNSEYNHSFVSLNWGGKRDSATFFSPLPTAKLGILLIPLSPTSLQTMPASRYIKSHLQETIGDANYNLQFGDYLLMYSSLVQDKDHLSVAKALPDDVIDGANSRSYMYAWLISQQNDK